MNTRHPLRGPAKPAPLARSVPLNRALQLDNSGCFPACLAMIAGRTYEQVAELAATLGWLEDIRRLGTHRDQQQVLFALTGVAVGPLVLSRNWWEVRQLALVMLRYPAFGTVHSVVYDPVAGGVLDPNPDITVEVRRDFDNMQMAAYLPILQLPSDRSSPRPYGLHRFAGSS